MSNNEKQVFAAPKIMSTNNTHYCPGCHHGVAHRLVAEVLEEMNLAEETVMVGSIGCSVFIYNYLELDCIEAPHGRAPAVATGVKRANPEKTVFSYQGDGDLASIGMAEIMHAANRGEKFTVIFVNNTVYGMTGGQMAPTTLIGQKTTTTPLGRNAANEGSPFKMTEIIAGLDAVAYAARHALDNVKHIKEAKKSIRKAFEAQQNNLGFSFVELLSACPTNWRMDSLTANKHLAENMVAAFPLGIYKDITAQNGGGN